MIAFHVIITIPTLYNHFMIATVLNFFSGTYAEDTLRHIEQIEEQHRSLDKIITLHQGLCTVVFNTVSSYSVWFVVHWVSYGVGVVLSVIYISKEILFRSKYDTPIINLVYLALFFACNIYLFLVPCIFAARITSKCRGTIIILKCTRILLHFHCKPRRPAGES